MHNIHIFLFFFLTTGGRWLCLTEVQFTVTHSIDQSLHQFLTLLLIWTLLPNLTFCLIAKGFHKTFATGATCQQRTLTPPDTWSCPTLVLASVLMLKPISPELVLFPDFWVSNIPRYFCFCLFRNVILWQLSNRRPYLFILLYYYWINRILFKNPICDIKLHFESERDNSEMRERVKLLQWVESQMKISTSQT